MQSIQQLQQTASSAQPIRVSFKALSCNTDDLSAETQDKAADKEGSMKVRHKAQEMRTLGRDGAPCA